MIPRDRIRTNTILSDVPFSNEELFEDDLLNNNNNIETYHTNPFLHKQPNYHIYIPKEATPESRCCRCDPLLLGMSLMLVFVLAMVCIVLIIVKR